MTCRYSQRTSQQSWLWYVMLTPFHSHFVDPWSLSSVFWFPDVCFVFSMLRKRFWRSSKLAVIWRRSTWQPLCEWQNYYESLWGLLTSQWSRTAQLVKNGCDMILYNTAQPFLRMGHGLLVTILAVLQWSPWTDHIKVAVIWRRVDISLPLWQG